VLEGKRMIMFVAPKKVGNAVVKKPVEAAGEVSDAPVKKAPQQKARKEYTGPKVEGEDFDD
ncbi:MAG: translation initiation factor IF-3, partial [Bacteroidaceae bacterium]|nr:translation initiation factor IF-3 [Bacteroidaceae bacterium]